MRGKVSKRAIDALTGGELLWDTGVKGFVARKLKSGRVSYGLKYTSSKSGRQRWLALGLHGALTPEQARSMAIMQRGRIASGLDPQGEREADRVQRTGIVTVSDLLDAHIEMYVGPRKLRSAKEIARIHNKYIKPVIGNVSVRELKRSHVVRVLDRVATNNGPVMADLVLAYLRKALNWFATRDDEFVVPIVRGMARSRPRERARDRILSDLELRALWNVTTPCEAGNYGALVRVLLLTGQRRQEVAGMRRHELAQGIWTIPAERAKNNRANVVPLPVTVILAIESLQPLGDYVFGDTGSAPYAGFSKSKARLDQAMKRELYSLGANGEDKPWVMHDLRRTARSLMARAGVRREIAERVLNHVISGVEGVYDRHDYVKEKRDALLALEQLISRIILLEPNVVLLDATRRGEPVRQLWTA
jgi:integrase